MNKHCQNKAELRGRQIEQCCFREQRVPLKKIKVLSLCTHGAFVSEPFVMLTVHIYGQSTTTLGPR